MPQAIEYMKKLKPLNPWFIEEPTAPDDYVGHAAIRKALAPEGIKVATGEHCHNRVRLSAPTSFSLPLTWCLQMGFKQLLQLEAIDVCQIDSCRIGGVSEILGVLLMSAK